MPTYKTPGVYIEEISTLPASVAPVATAIPAFIGYTKSTTDAEITWLIRGFNEHNTDTLKFYIDDMVLAEVELRP